MKEMLSSSKLVNVAIILTLVLSASPKKKLRMGYKLSIESDSIESGEDDESMEERDIPPPPGVLYMDLTGELRRTMIYHVAMSTKKSTVCSPLSALLPLGKLLMGSSSRDYGELKDATGYRRSKVVEEFKKVIDDITHISGNVQLTIASRLYVSHKYSVNQEFDEKVKDVFNSSCEREDFQEARETAANINDWVSSQTKGLIKDLVTPEQITPDTSLFVTNAIYFHGQWEYPFELAKEGTFKAPGKDIKVDMMTVEAYFDYTRHKKLSVEIINIPYSSKNVSLVIILPFANIKLDRFLSNALTLRAGWNNAFSSMDRTKLLLSIPKFKTITKLDLNSIYKKVGLYNIFREDNTILTKMIKGHRVFVSKSVHAAVIDVDEKGTEAAAASAVQVESKMAVSPTVVTANRPFLYFVMANAEQLFGGLYTGL